MNFSILNIIYNLQTNTRIVISNGKNGKSKTTYFEREIFPWKTTYFEREIFHFSKQRIFNGKLVSWEDCIQKRPLLYACLKRVLECDPGVSSCGLVIPRGPIC